MEFFLHCVSEICARAHNLDRRLKLTYYFDKDTIGRNPQMFSVRIAGNTEEKWTKALRYMLGNLRQCLNVLPKLIRLSKDQGASSKYSMPASLTGSLVFPATSVSQSTALSSSFMDTSSPPSSAALGVPSPYDTHYSKVDTGHKNISRRTRSTPPPAESGERFCCNERRKTVPKVDELGVCGNCGHVYGGASCVPVSRTLNMINYTYTCGAYHSVQVKVTPPNDATPTKTQ